MSGGRTVIVINACREAVWEILSDFESYSWWNPFVIHMDGGAESGKLANTMVNGSKKRC